MDEKKIPLVPLLLISAATLPFILQFLLLAVQMTDASFALRLARYNDYTVRLFLMYCFIILIFLAGLNWGMVMKSEAIKATNGLYISSILLVACISFLLIMVFYYRIWIFFIVALLFGVVWCLDYVAYRKNINVAWYMRLCNIVFPMIIMSLLGIQVIIFFVRG